MSFQSTIPLYIVYQPDDDDDVDSVISFVTNTSTSSSYELWDAEARWALESRHMHRCSLTNATKPHHPRRSQSIEGVDHGNSSNNDCVLPVCSTKNNGHNGLPVTNDASPVSPAKTKRGSLATPPTRHIPNRTTRLTRMAERAKAVAVSCKSPIRSTSTCRRRQNPHRHSLPPVPVRRSSSSFKLYRQHQRRPSLCSVEQGSSSLSPSSTHIVPIAGSSCPKQRSGVVRRNSMFPTIPFHPRTTTGNSCTDASFTPRRQQQQQQQRHSCFAVPVCRASQGPPRLPQRHPSEAVAAV